MGLRRRPRSNWIKREDGAVTVEAAIWLPFFVFFVTLIADLALIFHGQARALRIVQDANRNFSVGLITSEENTAASIEQRLAAENLSANAQAVTVLEEEGFITSVVTIPSGDLAAVGFFTELTSFDLQVSSQQVMEN